MVRQFVFQSWSIWTVSSKVFNLICVDENSKEKNVAWKCLMPYKNKNEKMYVYYCPHVDTCIRKYTYRFYNSMGDKRVPWPLWENTPYRPGHLTQSSSEWGRLFGGGGILAEFWRMHTCTHTYTHRRAGLWLPVLQMSEGFLWAYDIYEKNGKQKWSLKFE